ncbi:MAG: methionyl-tRNA formyltransferase [Bacteroidetes bacterium]|nr:methionyl-tRNA formyltransferase [Bacteroidota bacterium]
MGTPEFAVASLDFLRRSGFAIAAVITAPDKPAGRGRKMHMSAVKEYALEHKLPVLQPESLKDTSFLEELKHLNADLHVVVAFRMLPKVVWNMPPKGTINLHASLLPDYRGAAPLNWVLINGETETGLTTFFLNENIDTGDIIMTEKVSIGKEETLGELHDRMKALGAQLLVKTVEAIRDGKAKGLSQEQFVSDKPRLMPAPKIHKEDCRINWDKNADEIFNLIRGLSPVPGAYTLLDDNTGHTIQMKIFKAGLFMESHVKKPGSIETDGKTHFRIFAKRGWIEPSEIQLEGKRHMTTAEWLRGTTISDPMKAI